MIRVLIGTLISVTAIAGHAQNLSTDPFPTPIEASNDVIASNFIEFAQIPMVEERFAPRLMHMTSEPGTQRLFVSVMTGALYSMNYEGGVRLRNISTLATRNGACA